MGPKTPNNDIEQTDDDETMRLVVDDLASAVEMKEQDESWEKEKLVWAKRKAEREQHLKEMKELADQEAELKQELLQKSQLNADIKIIIISAIKYMVPSENNIEKMM